ncbi:hypothetical protein DRO21_05280 [archaeon]|nr:MAG: hypothetical protein DRJ59_05355 [Thermoprotei archaeon]RLG63800.1 MAG: hypothetical protein DRO21_05280 [archaeon]
MSIQLSNGTIVNVTIYEVNQTIKIGNVTVVVQGYVSRLGIDLDVYVFSVPLADYNVKVKGLNATIEH